MQPELVSEPILAIDDFAEFKIILDIIAKMKILLKEANHNANVAGCTKPQKDINNFFVGEITHIINDGQSGLNELMDILKRKSG